MRALVCQEFGPPEQLEWIELPNPQPKADEVVVSVSAAGVGFVDGLMVQGKYQVKPPLPYYPGSEFAGKVTERGSDVTHLNIGDRVMGLANSGAFSEQVAIRANNLVQLPESISDATAAGFYINYATALFGLRDCGKLQAGETVLILGAAGGVGSAAIAVAKAMGATVVAAASSDAKRRAAISYGADTTIDYTAVDWRDQLKQANTQINLVYDPVGGPYSDPAFRTLAPGGRFLVVGFAAGEIPKIALNLALLKRSSIVGVDWGGEARANPEINAELMSTLIHWVEVGKLSPAAVSTRDLTDAKAALAQQLSGNIVGKLVLTA